MARPTYLDYNATVPLRPAAAAAVAAALQVTGNPSSVHAFGRRARRLVEDARAQVAALVGARPEQVVFTGGGTEANNLALAGVGRRRRLVSAIEHDSVLNAAPGAEVLPVARDGVVVLDALAERLAGSAAPALVSVMLANNETGVVQPVAEVAALAHRHGALVHCDAVQAAGKVAVDLAALGVDLMSVSAHKLGGPQGAGALIVADGIELAPLLRGGGQERGRRAGTENLAAIAGFGAAAAALAACRKSEAARVARLRDDLEARVQALVPGAKRFGAAAPRLGNTACIAMPGVASEIQVMGLDLAGVAVSAGAACSSGKVRPSHVLRAMGASEAEAATAIRVSLGWASVAEDVDRFVEAWGAVYARAQGGVSRLPAA
jgi:cysteine desulfurase